MKTFTISFPGHGEFDEAAHARLVANHFGTEHARWWRSRPASICCRSSPRQFDEPIGDSSMVPTYLVSKMIRSRPRSRSEATAATSCSAATRTTPSCRTRIASAASCRLLCARPSAARRRGCRPARADAQRILRFTADLSRNLVRVNHFFDAEQRAQLLRPIWQSIDGRAEDPEALRVALAERSHSALQQATRVDFLTYLCDDILAKVDRASMLTSLEVRAPLLDYRIIEFAFGRLPDSFRAARGERKLLLRTLGRKLLPPALDLTRKQGFSVPFDDWFTGEWGRFIEEVVREADPAVFDRNVIERLLRDQRDRVSHRQRLFALTMFELWRRRYGISVTA